jgi:hypothetical protein
VGPSCTGAKIRDVPTVDVSAIAGWVNACKKIRINNAPKNRGRFTLVMFFGRKGMQVYKHSCDRTIRNCIYKINKILMMLLSNIEDIELYFDQFIG